MYFINFINIINYINFINFIYSINFTNYMNYTMAMNMLINNDIMDKVIMCVSDADSHPRANYNAVKPVDWLVGLVVRATANYKADMTLN